MGCMLTGRLWDTVNNLQSCKEMNDIVLGILLLKSNLVLITQQHFLANPIWLHFGFILILLFFYLV